MVRRGVGHGGPDQHRAEVPALIRHGAGVEQRGTAGGAGLHRGQHRDHDRVRRRSRRAGPYATGVLAMMLSAAFAVAISALKGRRRLAAIGFTIVALVMLYALLANVAMQPDGIAISAAFIAGIVVIS